MDQLHKIFFKKKILIYGLGISGYSSLNFLKKKNYIKFFDDNYQNFKNKKLKKFFISQKKIYEYGLIFEFDQEVPLLALKEVSDLLT